MYMYAGRTLSFKGGAVIVLLLSFGTTGDVKSCRGGVVLLLLAPSLGLHLSADGSGQVSCVVQCYLY